MLAAVIMINKQLDPYKNSGQDQTFVDFSAGKRLPTGNDTELFAGNAINYSPTTINMLWASFLVGVL